MRWEWDQGRLPPSEWNMSYGPELLWFWTSKNIFMSPICQQYIM